MKLSETVAKTAELTLVFNRLGFDGRMRATGARNIALLLTMIDKIPSDFGDRVMMTTNEILITDILVNGQNENLLEIIALLPLGEKEMCRQTRQAISILSDENAIIRYQTWIKLKIKLLLKMPSLP